MSDWSDDEGEIEVAIFDFDKAREDIASGRALEGVDALALVEELLKKRLENDAPRPRF